MLNKYNKEFLDLKVNVFRNSSNGQMSVALPKKVLKNIPNKIDIKIPIQYFKDLERRNK